MRRASDQRSTTETKIELEVRLDDSKECRYTNGRWFF